MTELEELIANRLRSIHFDGTGCGGTPYDTGNCSNCYGPSPMSADEIAEEVVGIMKENSMFGWIFCEDELPEEGVLVETRSPNGLVQSLKRDGNLWFVPDGSMYVYYIPITWRKL